MKFTLTLTVMILQLTAATIGCKFATPEIVYLIAIELLQQTMFAMLTSTCQVVRRMQRYAFEIVTQVYVQSVASV